MSLGRRVGVRTAYVVVAALVWFGTLFALSQWPDLEEGPVLDALEWLLGVLGLAVGGDTVRPSGQARAAIGSRSRTLDSPTG